VIGGVRSGGLFAAPGSSFLLHRMVMGVRSGRRRGGLRGGCHGAVEAAKQRPAEGEQNQGVERAAHAER
jgi:hypothetical protein